MKYLLVAIGFTLAGFFAGYLLTRDLAKYEDPRPLQGAARLTSETPLTGTVITVPTNSERPAFRFEDIEKQQSVFQQQYVAYQLAASAGKEQLERYLDECIKSGDPLFSYNLANIFLERYTAIDPKAAIGYIRSNVSINQTSFLGDIMTSWIRHDPEAAIDFYRNISDRPLQLAVGARLLSDSTLASTSREMEIRNILGTTSGFMVENARINRLGPAGAFDEALLKTGQVRTSFLANSISRWMRTDPEAAMDRVSLIEDPGERSMLMQMALGQYARLDPEAALAYVQDHIPDNPRLEQQMLQILGQTFVEGALPLIEDYVRRTGNINPITSLVSSWVQKDPVSALEYANSLPQQQREKVFQTLAYSYTSSDPEAGFAWVLGLDDSYRTIKEQAMQMINRNNIDVAERAIDTIDDAGLRKILISGVARHKAQVDPENALQWLESYEGDPAYDGALQFILSTWSHQNPRQAARLIETRLDQKMSQQIVSQIAHNWYQADRDEAISWIESLPEGKAKTNAMTSLTNLVSISDPQRAMRMIEMLPEGDAADNARRNIAYAWITREPESLQEIIDTLDLDDNMAEQIRQLAERRDNSGLTNALYLGR